MMLWQSDGASGCAQMDAAGQIAADRISGQMINLPNGHDSTIYRINEFNPNQSKEYN